MSIDKGGIPEPDAPGPGGEDPFDVVLDEDFIKGATTKEPSARARELKARWTENPPGDTGWRTGGSLRQDPEPDPDDADGAGEGGDASRSGKKQRREKKPKTPVGGSSADRAGGLGGALDGDRPRRVWPRNLAVTAVAVGIVFYLLHPKHPATTPVSTAPAGSAEPTAGTVRPSAPASFTDPDDKYFVGSPSLDWADNAAGINPPAAAAIGGFDAATVASGYQQMTKLLVAGNLDAATLAGGAAGDFTALIDPLDHGPLAGLSAALAAPSYQHNPVLFVTRFDPAKTRLLGSTVKVNGSMSASVNSDGYLLITGDYRFVYAVGPARGGADSARAMVHRLYQVAIFPAGLQSTPGRIWLYTESFSTANDTCFLYNGFVNPAFGSAGGVNSTKTVDPYASENLLPAATASGTAPSGPPSQCPAASRV